MVLTPPAESRCSPRALRGNIRELQNVVEGAVILSTGPVLKVPLHDLEAPPAAVAVRKPETLEEAERRHNPGSASFHQALE